MALSSHVMTGSSVGFTHGYSLILRIIQKSGFNIITATSPDIFQGSPGNDS